MVGSLLLEGNCRARSAAAQHEAWEQAAIDRSETEADDAHTGERLWRDGFAE
jgi:hypothetical protein